VNCTERNVVGSVCRFTCAPRYFLQGSAATTCGTFSFIKFKETYFWLGDPSHWDSRHKIFL